MYRGELDAYCARHSLEVVNTYDTWGEAGTHYRAIVQNSVGERFYLYYDRSRRRQTLTQQKRHLDAAKAGDLPPLSSIPKARGWRNTTLDNRKRAERMARRREEDERMRAQQEAESGCNGHCNPAHALYEGQCPVHGAKAFGSAQHV